MVRFAPNESRPKSVFCPSETRTESLARASSPSSLVKAGVHHDIPPLPPYRVLGLTPIIPTLCTPVRPFGAQERRTRRMLELMSTPKQWQMGDGEVAEITTPWTKRARELQVIYIRCNGWTETQTMALRQFSFSSLFWSRQVGRGGGYFLDNHKWTKRV